MAKWYITIGWFSFIIEIIGAIIFGNRVFTTFSFTALALFTWFAVIGVADLFTLLEAD